MELVGLHLAGIGRFLCCKTALGRNYLDIDDGYR